MIGLKRKIEQKLNTGKKRWKQESEQNDQELCREKQVTRSKIPSYITYKSIEHAGSPTSPIFDELEKVVICIVIEPKVFVGQQEVGVDR